MVVYIYRVEPTEDTSNVQYAPPTVDVDAESRSVTITRQKRLNDMTSADKDEEIRWAGEVLVSDLQNRGLAEALIDTILRVIADGIHAIERRLATQGASGA
jgi:hypothetical protein